MYRRRRRCEREIAFSFDSFLDLVANVVGIIIRLILVAWVGARTYTWVGARSGDRPPGRVPLGHQHRPEGLAALLLALSHGALLPHACRRKRGVSAGGRRPP